MKKLLTIGLIVGIIFISGCITEEQESQKDGSISEDCLIKIPKTIKLVALKAYPSSEIDSDYIEIRIAKNLCVLSYSTEADGYYLVQFMGPVYENNITSLGGVMHGYIPENAFIVKMNGDTKDNVQKLDGVKWVGIYQPAYKMQPSLINSLNKTGDRTLNVLVFDGEDITDIANRIESFGGITGDMTETSKKFRARIDGSKIPSIANIDGVLFIEEFIPFELS